MSVTTVRLKPNIEKDLEALAGTLQRSKSWVINQALEEFMIRQESEKTRWEETLNAMESVAQGRLVSGDAVHDLLQTWGSEGEQQPPTVGK